MMGKQANREEKLFYTRFTLDGRVPADHLLRRVDAVADFSFVRGEVEHLYGGNGRVSLDPAMVLRMMMLVYLEGVRSEREFMRQLPMRLDWLWFCGLDLDSTIPDHSVLSKARRRWGEQLFRKFFDRVLAACVSAGLVGGQTVHADSTLLKANADKEGRVSRVLWEQMENGLRVQEPAAEPTAPEPTTAEPVAPKDDTEDQGPSGLRFGPVQPESPARSERATLNNRLVSPVDPDAATHTRQGVGTILGYRDHRLTDDRCGIILATHITPADGDDGAQLPVLLGQMDARLERTPLEVAGDSQYGTASNYDYCKKRRIKAYLKKRRGKDTPKVSWLNLLPEGCTRFGALRIMRRRRIVAEGSFAEAHTRMDHWRCRWRGRWRVQIQAYLVATVQNFKKLAKGVRNHPMAPAKALGNARNLPFLRSPIRRSPHGARPHPAIWLSLTIV
jgi:transposase